MCPRVLSLPGSLSVSFTQESSCSLPSKHNFYYYLHNITTPYTLTLSSNQNSSNTLTLDFCNIRGLESNLQSVEHHLTSTKPHLVFLTETQLSVTTDSSPFSVPSFFLYPHLQSKGGCCAYVRNNITSSRAHNLECSEFSTIWLRLQCHSWYTWFTWCSLEAMQCFTAMVVHRCSPTLHPCSLGPPGLV